MKTKRLFSYVAIAATAFALACSSCNKKDTPKEDDNKKEEQGGNKEEESEAHDRVWVYAASDEIIAPISTDFYDLRCDGEAGGPGTTFLYRWDYATGDFNTVPDNAINFQGKAVGGYISYHHTGYMPICYNSTSAHDADLNALKKINPDIDDYYFHIALMADAGDDKQEWLIELFTGIGSSVKWIVSTVQSGNKINLPRDGKWHEFDLNLGDAGAVFGTFKGGANTLYVGAVDPCFMDSEREHNFSYDAAYIYKK